jgi:hypothetical protein
MIRLLTGLAVGGSLAAARGAWAWLRRPPVYPTPAERAALTERTRP